MSVASTLVELVTNCTPDVVSRTFFRVKPRARRTGFQRFQPVSGAAWQRFKETWSLAYSVTPSLSLFEVVLFCFRGNAPAVCLAQPNGLGFVKTRSFQGQRPDHLESPSHAVRQTGGPLALRCYLYAYPARWAGLGKWLDLRPEMLTNSATTKLSLRARDRNQEDGAMPHRQAGSLSYELFSDTKSAEEAIENVVGVDGSDDPSERLDRDS